MTTARVSTDAVMEELHGRIRERLRQQLIDSGVRGSEHPEVFADVEALLRRAAESSHPAGLLLPELLGDPSTWRLNTALAYQSHRAAGAASLVIFLKQRILMPMLRWLFEYSRDNFERQRRLNYVLFACVQELAVETALLRRQIGDQGSGIRDLESTSESRSPIPGPRSQA